jgi:hypothetical protein
MMARSCPWRSLVMVLVAGLVGLASAPSRSFAQVAVTGRVVEARTGAPIAGAAVSVEGTQITDERAHGTAKHLAQQACGTHGP